jgi:hypothetical protein
MLRQPGNDAEALRVALKAIDVSAREIVQLFFRDMSKGRMP